MSSQLETNLGYLKWLRERLVNIYHEDPGTDFVIKLDTIIKNLEAQDGQRSKSNS